MTEPSRASCLVTREVWVIHELNFKVSKEISWKSQAISHQKLPMGENGLYWKVLFKCDAESRGLGEPETLHF